MANSSVNKGRRGEQQVMAELTRIVEREYLSSGIVSPELARSRRAADIRGLPWLALEVKYREQVCLEQWWDQAKRQAGSGQLPVLVWRSNHQPWRVRMYGQLPIQGSLRAGNDTHLSVDTQGKKVRCPVDISWEHFLLWFQHQIRATLPQRAAGA